MQYPYTRIDSKLPPRPYVNLFFRSKFATTDSVYGLVDTGADYSILPIAFAETLKLTLQEGKPWSFRGTTGVLQIAYLHSVELSIWDADNKALAFRFQTEVSFCQDFQFPGGLLLGQSGFLSHFKSTFEQRDNLFELAPHDPSIVVSA
jgi:hypothetical protein